MNKPDEQTAQTSTLPELEHLLIRAARRRAAPNSGRRRLVLATAAATLLLVAGAAAAATDMFQIAGKASNGTFNIESRVVPSNGSEEHQDSICLQLRFEERGAAYGCGVRPTAAKPFGLVIADPLNNGDERVIYGLVSSDISRVSVRGGGGSQIDAVTGEKAELPGRFFYVVAPNDGRIELVGYNADGEERARLGNLESPADPPLSRAEAMAQGDPAGFAPGFAPPSAYVYRGESISPAKATRLKLVCSQGREIFHCYDSEAEAEAAVGTKPKRR
jgi:hypothetical protein